MNPMKKMLLALFIGVFLMATTVHGASINFQANDPTDVTNADFDITSFGATDNGNTVTFWMEVRGNINEHPADGYINGYEICIEDIEMTAMWINSSGMITPFIVISTEGGSYSTLSPGEYIISGGRLEFHIDSSFFSNIGENYTVTVYTAHVLGSNPTTSSHLDEATYSHYASESPTTGNSSGGLPWYLWLIIALVIVAVIVAVVLVVLHKPKQVPPQYPPQYPPKQ